MDGYSTETIKALLDGDEKSSDGWVLRPTQEEKSGEIGYTLCVKKNGEGPPREWLYSQLLRRAFQWGTEPVASFRVYVYEWGDDILDNGRNISKWTKADEIKDEDLRRAGTGRAATAYPVTAFEMEILFPWNAESHPHLVTDTARILTDAICKKHPPKLTADRTKQKKKAA